MDILKVGWELSRVPIGSRGGSNTCWKIGPMVACIYDDWKPRSNGISEEDNALAARAISLVPAMVNVIENIVNGNTFIDTNAECEAILKELYQWEDRDDIT